MQKAVVSAIKWRWANGGGGGGGGDRSPGVESPSAYVAQDTVVNSNRYSDAF